MNTIDNQYIAQPATVCERDGCCSTTEDGSAVCQVPQTVHLPTIVPLMRDRVDRRESRGMWQKVRTGVLFGVACAASPCCTPLIVPLVVALLAGTPVAAWIGSNLGWVYGGLTLLSVASFVLAFRRLNKPASSRPTPVRPSAIPVITTQLGDTVHVD